MSVHDQTKDLQQPPVVWLSEHPFDDIRIRMRDPYTAQSMPSFRDYHPVE
jgi:hypothetical protein